MKSNISSPYKSLWRFGLRQSRRGALVMGLVAGGEAILQGYAYASSYSGAASQATFVASLKSVPALGIIYGETSNLVSPAGYMVYRTVAFLGLIAAIWAIFVVTRLLRGFEEDGRWEVVTSGAVSSRRASYTVFLGFLTGFVGSFCLAMLIILIGTTSSSMELTVGDAVRMTAAIYLPALTFAALAYITSQLAVTRRRALSYSLYPLIGFFILRALGNTIPDIYWLKNITPFGWAERFSPIVQPAYGWLALFAVVIVICVTLAIYLVGKRDLGGSLIREQDHIRSKFFLLGSSTSLALRQSIITIGVWAVSAIGISLMIAAIAKIAVQALNDSPSLKAAFSRIGSSSDIQVAFLGMGAILTVMILLIIVTTSIANIRSNEAKNYLDTILVSPVRRTQWLLGRLSIVAVSLLVVSLLSVFATWLITQSQHITIDLGNLLLIGIALTGTAIFTLGVGTFLYGLIPRFAAAGLYVIIGWSFLLDTLNSVVTLNDTVAKSSLFHYVNPGFTNAPDWKTFAWLVGLGLAFTVLGVVCFNRRDIISE